MAQKQVSCSKGHYYLENLGECPICKYDGSNSTVLLDIGGAKEVKKMGTISSTTQYISSKHKKPEAKIATTEIEEVVLAGWLVILSSLGKGKNYPITFGFNTIGREDTNHVSIENDDKSISREKHASIIYDYTNNIYFLKHENGKFLTYLNDEVVLETKKLVSFDKIKVGNTELLFVALCGDNFQWDD